MVCKYLQEIKRIGSVISLLASALIVTSCSSPGVIPVAPKPFTVPPGEEPMKAYMKWSEGVQQKGQIPN